MTQLIHGAIALFFFACAMALLGGALYTMGQWCLEFRLDDKEKVTHLAGVIVLVMFSIGIILYASAT